MTLERKFWHGKINSKAIISTSQIWFWQENHKILLLQLRIAIALVGHRNLPLQTLKKAMDSVWKLNLQYFCAGDIPWNCFVVTMVTHDSIFSFNPFFCPSNRLNSEKKEKQYKISPSDPRSPQDAWPRNQIFLIFSCPSLAKHINLMCKPVSLWQVSIGSASWSGRFNDCWREQGLVYTAVVYVHMVVVYLHSSHGSISQYFYFILRTFDLNTKGLVVTKR